MASAQYKPLDSGSSDSSEDSLSYLEPLRQRRSPGRLVITFLLAFLSGSLCLNGLFVYQKLQPSTRCPEHAATKYAGLLKNVPVSFSYDTIYVNENRTLEDEAWDKLIPETGLVALTDEFVQSKGLLPAQRWPWDDTKGIYLLNGFHNLHCLHVARHTVLSAYDNRPLTYPLEHVSHCLSVLLEEVMCNADDTPRYTGSLNAEAGKARPTSGIGEVRMCKDWSKLEDFAVEHSACFKAINETTPGFPTKERYKFCPDGRVLWPQ
ncbi:Phenylalanine aminomutase (L-beta-phenylalanine forming) [Lachnellula suecica]|uniref:Phenylalanine aminomutase (L-beta-phenylalanine forming) n=1 Tax=Lachnellula suecica TaxID=602035 RepID=A0A8T9CNR3_9HELO|nr:Phenylalanine aminomutase (L-beta-phenylalanine forming) [Lachnellula suecica]